ncbi:hypothetical protein QTP88_010257 [Uroleucon formosanum]
MTELDGDYRLNVTEENFKVNIFLPTIDTVLSQLISRFEGTHDVADSFGFLTPTTLLKLNDSDIIKSSYDFVLKYENDITSDFARQLIALKTVIINSEIKTIKDLAQFIISNSLPSSFPDILSACIIFMCIPVTVASAERSFSKLKLIKNYLRNTCNQDRLSSLASVYNDTNDGIEDELEDSLSSTQSPISKNSTFSDKPHQTTLNKKKKKRDFCDEVLEKVNNKLQNDNLDEFDIIGQNFAYKLRGLSKEVKVMSEKFMNDILFEAEIGNINKYTKMSLQQHAPNQSFPALQSHAPFQLHTSLEPQLPHYYLQKPVLSHTQPASHNGQQLYLSVFPQTQQQSLNTHQPHIARPSNNKTTTINKSFANTAKSYIVMNYAHSTVLTCRNNKRFCYGWNT